jgi:low molecular weight protein-tyrosine phosphatase
MASILVVCTGNVCRSPIAEAFLRSALRARFGDRAPSVASAGTSGWEGSRAEPGSVAAAAERGLDVSGHRARRLRNDDVDGATLVVTMATEHRDDIADLHPRVADRTFTLKELVRLLEGPPASEPGPASLGAADPETLLRDRVAEAHELRRAGFGGNPHDEDVVDPLGMPAETYRAVAAELQEWCERLAAALFGLAPAHAAAGAEVD